MRQMLFVLGTAVAVSCAHTLEGPCPEIDAVYNPDTPERPALVIATMSGDLIVEGSGFEVLPNGLDGREVEIPEVELRMGDDKVALETVKYGDEGYLSMTVNPRNPPLPTGLWDLVVTNPSGCDDVLKEAVEVRETALDDSILVAEIIPPFGWTEQDTAVTIKGDGFVSTPRAWLSIGDFTRDHELDQVAFIDATSLSAIVPAGIAPSADPFDLIIENPDGGFNYLEDAFTVTELAPPDIFTVLPEAGNTQEDTAVVITGENFDPGIAVSLWDADGAEVAATVDSASPTEIQATFPTSGGLGVGAYIVRATNEDGTWDEHAAFVNRNPSAKLGTEGSWAESEPLNSARTGNGLVSHIDDLGRGFLYVVAGEDGSGAPYDTVERAQTDAFGTLATWDVLGTRLTTPRAHGAFVEVDGWVYAIGGDDGGGPVDTIERARILTGDADIRPQITEATVEEGAGGLAAGVWYYRVSAVMSSVDPENPDGETPASRTFVVRVDRDDSAVTLSWGSVSGADHYRVYRTDEANGAAGQEHRIADDLSSPGFTDDGKPAGTEGYVPEGALGEWQELTTTLPAPWAHGAAVLADDPNGDRYVYLVGGVDGGGMVADVVAWDFSSAPFVAGTLTTPRRDNMATVAGFDQAQVLGAGSPNYLLAMEGDDGGGATNDIVQAAIQAGGTLGSWSTLDSLNAGGQARIDGIGLAAAGHVYILGGGGDANDASDSGRQAEVDGPGMLMRSWSSTSQSGTFAVPRADFGLTLQRATLYAAGGRTDADAATTSVEQVVF